MQGIIRVATDLVDLGIISIVVIFCLMGLNNVTEGKRIHAEVGQPKDQSMREVMVRIVQPEKVMHWECSD